MKRKPLQSAALAALALAGVGGAFAAHSTANDALGIADAKTTLTQAIAAAERQVGGKASRADYERHQGQWVFEVEVVNGNKVVDVRVDPASGKVLAVAEDQADHEDREDQEDRNEHLDGQDHAD